MRTNTLQAGGPNMLSSTTRRPLIALGIVGVFVLLMPSTLLSQEDEPQDSLAVEEEADVTEQEGYEQIDAILEGDEELLEGGGYSYDAAGRRDPFFSLATRGGPNPIVGERPDGVPGLLIDEIDIKGIFTLEGRSFAQVQSADQKKAHIIQQGDVVFDGEVIRVSRNEVVFKQQINDPSIIKPFREVVKRLNPEP